MTRPGFALSVLLVTLTGSLIAVRTANSQQLDNRVGGIKYGLCPLIGDELYDGGFGAHVCDVRPVREECDEGSRFTKSYKAPFFSLATCSVSEWFREWTKPQVATQAVHEQIHLYLSGYDALYDKIVYGYSEPKPKSSVQIALKPGNEDWSGWDWCEGECGKRIAAQPAPAVAAVARKPMEKEPLGIEEYFSMYGGKHYRIVDYSIYDDNFGYSPANAKTIKVSTVVRTWSKKYAKHMNWETVSAECVSRRDQVIHRLMLSPYWPICADMQRTWDRRTALVSRTSTTSGAEEACRRAAVRMVAQSLNEAALMLQNASRCLTQLVENPPTPVSAAVGTPDQR